MSNESIDLAFVRVVIILVIYYLSNTSFTISIKQPVTEQSC